MKRALVLGGGGALGAFQYGALKYIKEHIKPKYKGFDYQIIAGVSVGTLNGAMVAMNRFDLLEEFWTRADLREQVFEGELKVWQILRRLTVGERSLLDSSPLLQTVERIVNLEDFDLEKRDFRMGLTSLKTGQFYALSPRHFDSSQELRKAIVASASIPIAFTPFDKIQTNDPSIGENGALYDMVDGGLRNNSPLGQVVHDNPDEIIIINCFSPRIPMKQAPNAADNIFSIAMRSLLEIAINEIFVTDLREYLTINDLLTQLEEKAPNVRLQKPNSSTGRLKPTKAFRTVLIEPEEQLGDILDFGLDSITRSAKKGYQAAKHAFQGYYETEETRGLERPKIMFTNRDM